MSASLPGTSDSLALFNNSVLLQSLSCNFSSISVQLQDRHVTALLIVFVSLSVLLTQYLGHVEVDESRGMHICEDAVKRLKTVSFILSSLHTSKNIVAKFQTSSFLFLCSFLYYFPWLLQFFMVVPVQLSPRLLCFFCSLLTNGSSKTGSCPR